MSQEDKKHVITRLNYAKKWAHEFAPPEYKFIINKTIPKSTSDKLQDAEISALKKFQKKISSKKEYTEEEYQQIIKEIIDEQAIAPKSFYRAAYLAILNKEHGPKLTSLIKMLGQKETARVLSTLK